jgi:NADP-dependent 3-hydroxy acid dehydrogenase YdfG
MTLLSGKVAIITGASSGIGKAAAMLFAVHGASVVLVARREDSLRAVVEKNQKWRRSSARYCWRRY